MKKAHRGSIESICTRSHISGEKVAVYITCTCVNTRFAAAFEAEVRPPCRPDLRD
jgi:hypothetical protein